MMIIVIMFLDDADAQRQRKLSLLVFKFMKDAGRIKEKEPDRTQFNN